MALTQIRLSRQALDLSLTTAKIADLAVTTAKINDLAVTAAKLGPGAVTIDKLADFRPTLVDTGTVGVAAGVLRSNNTIVSYAGGTLAVSATGAHYVEISTAGVLSENTVGFTSGRFPIAIATCDGGNILISVDDKRAWLGIGLNEADSFIVREVPTGLVNGTNDTFTLANTPLLGTEEVFLNGVLTQSGGEDYTITTNSIVFVAGSIPQTGDRVLVTYRK